MTYSNHARPDASDIARMLRDRTEEVVSYCLPNAVRHGGFLMVGSLNGEPGQSLKIYLTGPKRGGWADYATSKSDTRGTGDMLDLVRFTMYGGEIVPAIKWAKGFLGLDSMDPAAFERQKRRAEAAALKRKRELARDEEKRRAYAEGHWTGASRLTPSSPPVLYLANRGIDFKLLGKLPGAIRFQRNMFHPELSEMKGERVLLPAMLTKFNGFSRGHAATHVTFLHFEAGKGWVKLPPVLVETADAETGEVTGKYRQFTKKIYGPLFKSAHIALWKGEHDCPLKDIPPGTPVYCSEGIEDGFSFAMANPQARVIAAGTLGNIEPLLLPPQAGDFIILAQNDTKVQPKKSLEKVITAQQAQARMQGSSRRVMQKRPPDGFKDWNDWLQDIPMSDVA